MDDITFTAAEARELAEKGKLWHSVFPSMYAWQARYIAQIFRKIKTKCLDGLDSVRVEEPYPCEGVSNSMLKSLLDKLGYTTVLDGHVLVVSWSSQRFAEDLKEKEN